ncbi:MAG: DMT family transporter [Candidatus Rokuibacteriota bacterium]
MIGRPLGGLLLLGGLTVFWGANWPAMKLAVRDLDPWTFRTVCLLAGGGALLLLVRAGGHSLAVPRRERAPLCLVALFNITAWHLLSAYGLTAIRAGRGAIIAYTMPLWTLVFGRLFLGEPLTGARVSAVVLGSAGLAVLIAPQAHAVRDAPAGALLMLSAAILWAVGTVLVKAFPWSISTASLTGWQLLVGAVPVTVGALVRIAWGAGDAAGEAGAVTPAGWVGLAYATFVGVTFCHWAWFKLVAVLPAAVAAIGILGIPVVGVLSSAVVLGEPVGVAELAALALVVSGLAVLLAGRAGPARG